MASNVIRIDYQNFSAIFNLSDLAYITLSSEEIEEVPVQVLRIALTVGEQSTIIVEESDPNEYEELKTLYLDLYTKWRNKADADREDERLLYSL